MESRRKNGRRNKAVVFACGSIIKSQIRQINGEYSIF